MNGFGELLNFMIGQTAQVAADKLGIPPAHAAKDIEAALAALQLDRKIGDLFDQEPAQPIRTEPATTAPAHPETPASEQLEATVSPFITPLEISAMYGVPVSTLALWRRRGQGPEWKPKGIRRVFYRRRQVAAWMKHNGYAVKS